MITIILAIAIVISLALLQYYSQRRPHNFPPGPNGLPWLGYAPFLRFPLQKGFEELSKKYGNICGFYLLGFPVVILDDAKTMKEGFANEHMNARPNHRLIDYVIFGEGDQKGIGTTRGREWQEQRRFALKNLKEFGLGKSKIESVIMDEVMELINGLRRVVNQPVVLEERLTIAVFNSLWYIISGEKYSHDDPKLLGLFQVALGSISPRLAVALLMPWVAKIFPKLSGYEEFIARRDKTFAFLQETIEDHKKSLDANNPRDFIDAYLREISLTTDPNSTFYKEEGELQLHSVLMELFLAGGGATNISVNWAVFCLMMNPNVQKKLHIEIDAVVGTDRIPSVTDRSKMPYMEAVIAESLRYGSLATIGGPHCTTQSMEFNGYTLPKNTIVVGNVRSIHHNKETWGDPENFRPERFLGNEGQFKGGDGVYAFSVGKRICPGETMARDELFLFLAGLIQQFRFEIDPNNPPTLEPRHHPIVTQSPPYKVIIKDRNSTEST